MYFIFRSMEVGPTFRITVPKYPTKDPNYRILAIQRRRFTHYYFYIHNEVLGPIVMRVALVFSFRTTYDLNGHNFIEHQLRHGKIGFRDNASVAVDDVLSSKRPRYHSQTCWTTGPSSSARNQRAAPKTPHFHLNKSGEKVAACQFSYDDADRTRPLHR